MPIDKSKSHKTVCFTYEDKQIDLKIESKFFSKEGIEFIEFSFEGAECVFPASFFADTVEFLSSEGLLSKQKTFQNKNEQIVNDKKQSTTLLPIPDIIKIKQATHVTNSSNEETKELQISEDTSSKENTKKVNSSNIEDIISSIKDIETSSEDSIDEDGDSNEL